MSVQAQDDRSPKRFVGDSLVVDVDVVNVFFNVKDHHRFVENLNKDDFVLEENNLRQKIRYFSSESQVPLSLGMLVDTSSSETPELQRAHKVARLFFDNVLVPGDEGLVVSFDAYVDLRQEFTGDHEALVNAVAQSTEGNSRRNFQLDAGPVSRMRSTALYDAIVGAARYRFAERTGRKAIIIVSDGQDMGSRSSAKDAIEAALKSNTICYVLLVADPNYMHAPDYVGVQRMSYLTRETGGRMIQMDQKLRNLEPTLLEIAAELRHHYSIGYTPQNHELNGEYRHVSIKCRQGFEILARRGYYAIREPRAPQMVEEAKGTN